MHQPMDRRTALSALSTGALAASQLPPDAGSRREIDRNAVDPAQFGARYDGESDDSAALQQAVDACASPKQWRNLVISGPLRVERPIMIDRPVDRSTGIFEIAGSANGRLIKTGEGPIFDSRLPMGAHPVTEYVRLSALAITGAGGQIFSGKFLRLQIERCFVEKMRVISTAKYVQSLEIFASRFVGAAARPIIECSDAYDISLLNSHFERAGRILSVLNTSNAVRIHNCIFESCLSPLISISGANSLTFNGNYTENNDGPSLVLGGNLGQSRAIGLFGNNLRGVQNSPAYEVILGRAESIVSGGNYCSGNLYDNGFVRLGDLRSIADSVHGRLTSIDTPVEVLPAGIEARPVVIDLTRTQGNGMLAAGGCVTVVRGTPRGTGRIALPISVSNGFLRKITIVNEGPGTLIVQPAATAVLMAVDAQEPERIAPGTARSYLEYASGRWCAL